jgi:biopolymer transport protein ExbD
MNRPTADVNTTPLIDVLLVLLVFLILLLPRSTHETRVSLPISGDDDGPVPVRLDIDADGQVYWDGRRAQSPEELDAWLSEAAQKVPSPVVEVFPERRTRAERVVQVLAQAQRARIQRLAIAATDLPQLTSQGTPN